MSDEIKAAGLAVGWMIVEGIGASLNNKAAGAVLCIVGLLAFIGILYGSWKADQTEKRFRRYRQHAGEQIGKAHERNEKKRC